MEADSTVQDYVPGHFETEDTTDYEYEQDVFDADSKDEVSVKDESYDEWPEQSDFSSSTKEEERIVRKKIQRRNLHRARSQFVLIEASVGDESSEEFESDNDQNIVTEETSADFGIAKRDIENKSLAAKPTFGPRNEQELIEYLRDKYVNPSHIPSVDDEIDIHIEDQALLPNGTRGLARFSRDPSPHFDGKTFKVSDKRDPQLFIVKCKFGKEQDICLHLMHKRLTYGEKYKEVKSVVSTPGAHGFLYIEAFKLCHVKDFISEITTLRKSINYIKQVPMKEMTDVLRVPKSEPDLKIGMWVRLRRGLYSGDLARIESTLHNEKVARVELLPRIDFEQFKAPTRKENNEEHNVPKKMRKKRRPKQILFTREIIEKYCLNVTNDGNYNFVFKNTTYSNRGFLLKEVNLDSLITIGVKPLLEELEMFRDGNEEINMEKMIPGIIDDEMMEFQPGDAVEVVENELVTLTGKVISVNKAGIVIMQPNHESLKDPLEFKSEELIKLFKQGDQVQVTSGVHKGNTGLVLKQGGDEISVLADHSFLELKLRRKDLHLCSHQSTGLDQSGIFQIGDLVNVSANEVGVILHISVDLFRVLTMYDKIIMVKPQALQQKQAKNARTLDSCGNTLMVGDLVDIIYGSNTGRTGKISHIFRSFIFIYTKEMAKDAGPWVACKSHAVCLMGGKFHLAGNLPQNSLYYASPRPYLQENSSTNIAFTWAEMKRNSKALQGKTVKIIAGPFKACIGTLKSVFDEIADIELHDRTVRVSLDHISLLPRDVSSGGTPIQSCFFGTKNRTTMLRGLITPLHGFSTPALGDATPMYQFNTPLRSSGNLTPLSGRSERTATWDPTMRNSDGSLSEFQSPNYSPAPSTTIPSVSETDNDANMSADLMSTNLRDLMYTPSESTATLTCTESRSEKYLQSPTYTPYPLTGSTVSSDESSSQAPDTGSFTPKLETHWHIPGLMVIIENPMNRNSISQGVIREITLNNMVKVEVVDEIITMVPERLTPVVPHNGDQVSIIKGDKCGLRGKLLSIDQMDGIVEVGNYITIFPMRHLCRVYEEKEISLSSAGSSISSTNSPSVSRV